MLDCLSHFLFIVYSLKFIKILENHNLTTPSLFYFFQKSKLWNEKVKLEITESGVGEVLLWSLEIINQVEAKVGLSKDKSTGKKKKKESVA